MLGTQFLTKIFGTRNDRLVRRMLKEVNKINALEDEISKLTDAELRAKTAQFKSRLANNETLEQILPEAFAVVRETAKRTLGMRHFDVQMIGGMVLHQGKISEMQTGEGKTLVATLPAYLNALSGKGVHIVTVNDYLAQRDAEWMSPIYEYLGLTVGTIITDMEPEQRQQSYAADITYGTNNEFGFDYLRDNMAFELTQRVQRPLHFAIVDEVDSILIDEARTPLIISGPTEDESDVYIKINDLVPQLQQCADKDADGDFYLDEKSKQAHLTETGHEHVEALMTKHGLLEEHESLYDAKNVNLMHHLSAALRAHKLFLKDVDYIVANNQVVIVDEHTGRTMPGRRWSDGLHQAVEAKEHVKIQQENQTLASITFQNYFRIYDKLAGMTGTADTEAHEFQQIYGLEVVMIPTNKPCVRIDSTDLVFLTMEDKFNAIIEDVKACLAKQQPVLVGTASIETSEILDRLLTQAKIQHQVLNAKFHEKEAAIIAQAGQPGMVTIATNMAGRGTDIVLGGNVEEEIKALDNPSEEQIKQLREQWQQRHQTVVKAGGLHVIGSERHEARRIDNQLRGRCARQGDPGSSRFYLSLQDNLLRIFAADRMSGLMQRFGMTEGEPLESGMLTRVIENSQRKVEAHNFEIRKQLLEFDDVANVQRKVIYQQRLDLLEADEIPDAISNIRYDVCDAIIDQYIPPETFHEQWDIPGLEEKFKQDFKLDMPLSRWLLEEPNIEELDLRQRMHAKCDDAYAEREKVIPADILRQIEKSLMLQALDRHWRDHLAAMDYLRQGIHLRGYAQKNPKQEYKREAFNLFSDMLDSLKYEVTQVLFTIQIQSEDEVEALEDRRRQAAEIPMSYTHAEMAGAPAANHGGNGSSPAADDEAMRAGIAAEAQVPYKRGGDKVGRNNPCPCGSGRKFKQCHGQIA